MLKPNLAALIASLACASMLVACGGAHRSALKSGERTIEVWAWGTEGELLSDFTREFEAENPGTRVQVTAIPADAAHDKILTSVAGNTAPDVAMIGTTWVAELAGINALDQAPSSIDQSKFFKGARDTNVIDGRSYGVPWYVETRVLYYRTDIAKTAGISRPPQTWDELKADAIAMQRRGGAKYGISLKLDSWQHFLPFLWQAGGALTKNGHFALDSAEAAEALGFYKSFVDEDLAPDTTRAGFDVTAAFVRGTHPMFFSGPWQMGLIRQAGGADFEKKWAIAPMPARRTNTSFVGGGNWAVFRSSRNREAAWKFVEWMSRPQTQARWYAMSNDLPANQAAWRLPELANDPYLSVFGRQLNSARSPLPLRHWEEIATALDTQLDQVLRSDRDGREAALRLDETLEATGTP